MRQSKSSHVMRADNLLIYVPTNSMALCYSGDASVDYNTAGLFSLSGSTTPTRGTKLREHAVSELT